MFNPFQKLDIIEAETFTSLPSEFRKRRRTQWSDHNRHNEEVECFLEGPSFDRKGNLLVVDIPFGRVFRINPDGQWTQIVEYDGWPNGLKLHKDGRAFIADYKRGLMVLDPSTGRIEPLLETAYSEGFKGLNDLHFSSQGDLYFTDQGQTGIADPTGRVFRFRANGSLDKLATNVPSPNGITLNTKENQVYVAVTRSLQIWRLPLMADGQPSKTGVAIQLSGGIGPDGLEMDAENGIVTCHVGVGIWRFDANGLPTHLIVGKGSKSRFLTNIAFGGEDLKTLYVTDSLNGEILRAKLPVAGKRLFGLQ
jgi:gluconolactonase